MRSLPCAVLNLKGLSLATRGVGSVRRGRGAVDHMTWVHPSYPWNYCVPVPSYDTFRRLSNRDETMSLAVEAWG